MINWPKVQARLGVAVDGAPGPNTYGALIDLVGSPCRPVAESLTKYAVEYEMTTPARLAEFIAQIANETGGFTRWEENLNYSVNGMMKTWPAHFTLAKAQACAGNKQAIAECAYGGRMGNGPEGCGDGWKYCGRGALQLTGKNAYIRFGKALGLDLVGHPELAADPFNSTLIALEFFRERNVDAAIDAGDFRKARILTNGGTIGLDNVARLRGILLAKLAA